MDPLLNPHEVAFRHAARLAAEVCRTAAKGIAVRAGLSRPLQGVALRIPAALALARLEGGAATGRRHLLTALRALAELDSHLGIALTLLPSEKTSLHHHRLAGNFLHRLIVTLAVRSRPARCGPFRGTEP